MKQQLFLLLISFSTGIFSMDKSEKNIRRALVERVQVEKILLEKPEMQELYDLKIQLNAIACLIEEKASELDEFRTSYKINYAQRIPKKGNPFIQSILIATRRELKNLALVAHDLTTRAAYLRCVFLLSGIAHDEIELLCKHANNVVYYGHKKVDTKKLLQNI